MNSDRLRPFWVYQSKCGEILEAKNIFILDEINRPYPGDEKGYFVYLKIFLSCCVSCLKFQTLLKGQFWRFHSGCRNVYEDRTTFGDGYDEQIFIGRLPNDPSEMNSDSDSECEESLLFPIRPCEKSCITNSILSYRHFRCSCQEFYRENFVRDLCVLSRVD